MYRLLIALFAFTSVVGASSSSGVQTPAQIMLAAWKSEKAKETKEFDALYHTLLWRERCDALQKNYAMDEFLTYLLSSPGMQRDELVADLKRAYPQGTEQDAITITRLTDCEIQVKRDTVHSFYKKLTELVHDGVELQKHYADSYDQEYAQLCQKYGCEKLHITCPLWNSEDVKHLKVLQVNLSALMPIANLFVEKKSLMARTIRSLSSSESKKKEVVRTGSFSGSLVPSAPGVSGAQVNGQKVDMRVSEIAKGKAYAQLFLDYTDSKNPLWGSALNAYKSTAFYTCVSLYEKQYTSTGISDEQSLAKQCIETLKESNAGVLLSAKDFDIYSRYLEGLHDRLRPLCQYYFSAQHSETEWRALNPLDNYEQYLKNLVHRLALIKVAMLVTNILKASNSEPIQPVAVFNFQSGGVGNRGSIVQLVASRMPKAPPLSSDAPAKS